VAHVEKHHRKPCARCAHGYARHQRGPARCTIGGCDCKGWRAQPGDRETWRGRWNDPAGKERSKSFARKLDAERHLVAIEDAKLRGAYVDPAAGRVKLGVQAERWYATKAALAPSTRRDYRKSLDLDVLPAFRDTPLAAIDALAVEEWLAKLAVGDPDVEPPRGPLGVKRRAKARAVLSMVLDSAVKGGKLARNAAKEVKAPKGQRREMHFLDAAQVEALAAAIDPRYRALVLFAAYLGVRPSELVALRMGRLDLLRGTARICEAAPEVDGKLCWGGVKTDEARTVRVLRSVAEEVGAMLAAQSSSQNDQEDENPEDGDPGVEDSAALVFTAPRGGPLRFSKWVDATFKPALRAANEAIAKLPKDRRPAPLPEDLRLYDLRHTCASLLIREGATVKAVQKQLGHATASITLDTYGHLFPDELPALAERLDATRAGALAARRAAQSRTPDGPVVIPLRKGAGQTG